MTMSVSRASRRGRTNKIRFLHVIKFNSQKKKISIGRGNDWETKIVDISVSRHHAQIKKEKDGFWMVDSNSKFGTLLYSFTPILLKINEPQYVQIGRSLLIVMVEKPWWTCCLSCIIPGDIEQGLDYCHHKDQFPTEYKKIYEESNKNLIPISQIIKKSNTGIVAKEKRVVPLTELSKPKDLIINTRPDLTLPDTHPFRTPSSNQLTSNHADQPPEFSRKKSRNRQRYDLTNPIIEHEEEAKGTIDFNK